MSRVLGVAAIQMAPVPYDLEATWSKASRLVREVKSTWGWVDLVLLPELCLHAIAPFTEKPGRWEVAEPVPGPTVERAQNLARELSAWLVPGSLLERAGEAIYNTAVVISPSGELVASYRKVFPWRPYESTAAGSEPCVFELPGLGRLGLCICYDMWFPEVGRELLLQGAEAILHPSLTTTWDRGLEIVLAQANAIFNQCYFLDVNAANAMGGGRSIFVDPEGTVLHQAGQGEEVFARQINLETVEHVRSTGTLGLNRLLPEIEARRQTMLPPLGPRELRPRLP